MLGLHVGEIMNPLLLMSWAFRKRESGNCTLNPLIMVAQLNGLPQEVGYSVVMSLVTSCAAAVWRGRKSNFYLV
jgi:hypothetical protein